MKQLREHLKDSTDESLRITMTLEEAIARCREKALQFSSEQKERALEYVQLMDWLKELKCLRQVTDKKYLDAIDGLRKAFGEDYDRYFSIELRRDLTGMFAEPKSLTEFIDIFGDAEPHQLR